jgi:hypothetical protein
MALISLRSLGLMWSAIAVAVVLAAAPGHAQSALTTSFNHFRRIPLRARIPASTALRAM